MAHTQTSRDRHFSGNIEIWNNLQCVISASSGFQRWLLECDTKIQQIELEQQVQRYLRESLETLAY